MERGGLQREEFISGLCLPYPAPCLYTINRWSRLKDIVSLFKYKGISRKRIFATLRFFSIFLGGLAVTSGVRILEFTLRMKGEIHNDQGNEKNSEFANYSHGGSKFTLGSFLWISTGLKDKKL